METKNEFIGRKNELAKLHKAYQNASSGNGQMVLVEGSAGIGKSGLVREFLKQIETDSCIIGTSECNDKENLNAYAPFKELLVDLNTSSSSTKGSADKFKSFVKEAGTSWIELIPVIGTYAKIGVETYQAYQNSYDKKPKVKIESESDIFRVFENEFRRLAQEKTVVVFIDDLQWADASSLNLVFGLGKAIRGNSFRILFIASYRANEVKAGRNKVTETGELVNVAHPFTDKLNMLRTYTKIENHVVGNSDWFHEWSLKPFSKSEIDKLINTRFLNNDFNQEFFYKMHNVTDGHPLFIVEVLSYLLAEGMITPSGEGFNVKKIELGSLPTSIDGVISEKVERLNKELQKVLAYASVNGEEFSFQIMEKILHMETEEQEDVLEDYLEELSKTHGLLAEDGTTSVYDFYFTQSLVHKFVYAQMSNIKRKRLHRKIANILKEIYGESLSSNQEMLDKYNLHNQIGLGLIDGVSLQMSLGNKNASSTQNENGEELNENIFIDAAIDELKKADNSYKLFAMAEALAFTDKAQAFLSKLAESNPGVIIQKFEVSHLRCEIYHWQGRYSDTLKWAEEMLKISKQLSNQEMEALSSLFIAKALSDVGDNEQAMVYVKQAIQTYEEINDDEKLLTGYTQLGKIQYNASKFDEAILTFEKTLKIAEGLNEKIEKAGLYRRLGMSYHSKSQYEIAISYFEKALNIFENQDSDYNVAMVYNNIGNSYNSMGAYDRSLTYFEYSLEIAKSQNDQVGISTFLSNIGMVFSDKGNYDKAIEFYQKSIDIDRILDDKLMTVTSLNNIALAYSAKGNQRQALEYLNESITISKSIKSPSAEANAQLYLGNVYTQMNRYEDAITQITKALDIYLELGDKASVALAYDDLGVVYSNLDNHELAKEYYQKSSLFYQSVGDKLSFYKNQNNLAAVEVENGDYQKAIEYFEGSLRFYEEIDDKVSQSLTGPNVATCHKLMGNIEHAILLYQKYIDLAESIGEKAHLADHYDKMGDALIEANQTEKSLGFYKKAVDVNSGLENWDSVVLNLGDLGDAQFVMEMYSEALKTYHEVIGVLLEHDAGNHDAFATHYSNMGACYSASDQYSDAIDYYKKGLNSELKQHGNEHVNVAVQYMRLGNAYYWNDDNMDAVESFKIAYETWQVIETEETVSDTDEARYRWGTACFFAGLNEDAERLILESLNYRKQNFGIEDENYQGVLEFINKYGIGSNVSSGEPVPSQDDQSQSSSVNTSSYSATEDLDTVFQSGISLYENQEYDKALNDFQKALEIITGYNENDDVIFNTGLINYHLGQTNKDLDKYDKSIFHFINAYNLYLKAPEPDNNRLAQTCSYLGDSYYFNEDYPNAIENHKEALDRYIQIEGSETKSGAWLYKDLGRDYYWSNDYEASIYNLKKALKIFVKEYGKTHKNVAEVYMRLGDSYLQTDNEYSAVGKYQKASAIWEQNFGANSEEVDEANFRMGKAYHYSDNSELASECLYKSLRFRRGYFGVDSKEYQKTDKWIREYLN